jgi:hypothetical protein
MMINTEKLKLLSANQGFVASHIQDFDIAAISVLVQYDNF